MMLISLLIMLFNTSISSAFIEKKILKLNLENHTSETDTLLKTRFE